MLPLIVLFVHMLEYGFHLIDVLQGNFGKGEFSYSFESSLGVFRFT